MSTFPGLVFWWFHVLANMSVADGLHKTDWVDSTPISCDNESCQCRASDTTITQREVFTPNGCGVPDYNLVLPWDSMFEPDCMQHDTCYTTCGSLKTVCDSDFLTHMVTRCRTADFPDMCIANAVSIYVGVRLPISILFFQQSQNWPFCTCE